ncbi:MAG: diguanylate cyclase [Desulfobacteraceae bacterium]|nr:diguanylate cyclase [Desulfobacteraceae bacterium]
MNKIKIMENQKINYNEPIEIADKIWWVGHYLPDDKFQCHVYLIENGKNSVLIDPGSKLTFKHTMKKIESIIPFSNIKYFICHHQDPDITGSMSLIDSIVSRKDAVILSHWRAIALLKHYGLEMPFQCVENIGWKIDIGNKILEFIFTPYLHFPGAFCTYDPETQILFSSDIFGGFTEGFNLIAEDESYFESMRPFHEHYMPSREILFHAVSKFEKLDVKLIAPQHGSIIPEKLINFIYNRLKNLDCGLFLLTHTNSDITRLSNLNKVLRKFFESIAIQKDFHEIASSLLNYIKEVLPVKKMTFYAKNKENLIKFDNQSMFRGIVSETDNNFKDSFNLTKNEFIDKYKNTFLKISKNQTQNPDSAEKIIIPLFSISDFKTHAIAELTFEQEIEIELELKHILQEISIPLGVAVERELILKSMEIERQKFYEQAIRDPLTGLYTRVYLNEAVKRMFAIHDREKTENIFAIVFDIDFFKSVNDTFGHIAGDKVLKKVSQVILNETRESDIQVRLGGEEFAVFIASYDNNIPYSLTERIRLKVSELKFDPPMENKQITISAGIAQRTFDQALEDLIHNADLALYEAKHSGRNCICTNCRI